MSINAQRLEPELPRPTGVEHLEYWDRRLTNGNYVYVIQGDPGGPIKIGTARDVLKRMKGLQTGNPQELRLLYVIPGTNKLEWNLHKRIGRSRVRGEWFDGDEIPAFLAFVADLAERIKAAHNPKATIPPSWEDFGQWKRTRRRRPSPVISSMNRELPPPVDAEEAKRRLAAHWQRPYRNQRLGYDE